MKRLENNTQCDYIGRISRALQYIDNNLETDLSLEIIAKTANYSSFHFHRIFKAITNESLNSYVNRKRIEKTASVLMHKKEISISHLSVQFGFSSNSSFTRAFKKFYGTNPSEFRRQNQGSSHSIRKTQNRDGKKQAIFKEYLDNINNLRNWLGTNAQIEIKEIPKMELAFVTSIGSKGIADAYNKLIRWAGPNRLLEGIGVKMITIYHDSFKITVASKIRVSAGIVLSGPVKVTGAVGLTTIGRGKFIVGSFEIRLSEFEKSWNSLFIWMSENNYTKADRDPFEIYHNDYRKHPENKSIVDFYIPIL